jgi:protein-L-isoaspartate(D-aspartate) O-methyltransferase
MINYSLLRDEMVKKQLLTRGIIDKRLLAVIGEIPREEFVDARDREIAYYDGPLPIGCSQTISQPYMVALMTQLLCLNKNDKVLEVGTGSGYQTAILAKLAKEVYSLERFDELAQQAQKVLGELKIKNVKVVRADGSVGYSQKAPFNAILVTAAAPRVPHELISQLDDNGRLVIPVGELHMQRILKLQKKCKKIIEDYYDSCVFVPLIGRMGWDSESE